MGRIPIRVEEDHPADEVLEESVIVGGRPRPNIWNVTRISRKDGELVFYCNVAAQVVSRRRHASVACEDGIAHVITPLFRLALGPGTDAPRDLEWFRLEVKARRGDKNAEPEMCMFPGEWVHFSEHPWAAQWYQSAPIRRAYGYRASSGVLGGGTKLEEELLDARAVEALEKLGEDPWEKNSGVVTAGISQPGPAQSFQRPPKSFNEDGTLVLGVSAEPREDLARELEAHPEIKKTLARSEGKGVWVGPKGARRSRVRDEDLTEEHSRSAMTRAIHQALAGPPDTDELRSEDWFGRPVAELAVRIYCTHIDNDSRRERYRR